MKSEIRGFLKKSLVLVFAVCLLSFFLKFTSKAEDHPQFTEHSIKIYTGTCTEIGYTGTIVKPINTQTDSYYDLVTSGNLGIVIANYDMNNDGRIILDAQGEGVTTISLVHTKCTNADNGTFELGTTYDTCTVTVVNSYSSSKNHNDSSGNYNKQSDEDARREAEEQERERIETEQRENYEGNLNFQNDSQSTIENAASGSTAVIDAGSRHTFSLETVNALKNCNANIELRYNIDGTDYDTLIPAGLDLTSYVDGNGYIGFLKIQDICNKYSATVNTEVSAAVANKSNWDTDMGGKYECAGFVAASLQAAGFDINPAQNGRVRNLRDSLRNLGFTEKEINYSGGTNLYSGEIKVGDVLIFSEKENDPRPIHTALVTQVTADGEIRITDANNGNHPANRNVDYRAGSHSTKKGNIFIYCYHYGKPAVQ